MQSGKPDGKRVQVNHLKRHLSVANVLSCMALFVALSGVAYAATLGKNAVKTKNIAKGAVTTQKLRNGAVTTPKIRNGSVIAAKIAAGNVGSTQLADGGVRSADLGGGVVTTAKLNNNAVTTAKIAASAVQTGQINDGAVTRAKLAPSFLGQLVKDVFYVTDKSASDDTSPKTATAECPPSATRKQVTGGGVRVLGPNTNIALSESGPVVDGLGNKIGWTATATEFAAEAGNWAIEVYAICAEF